MYDIFFHIFFGQLYVCLIWRKSGNFQSFNLFFSLWENALLPIQGCYIDIYWSNLIEIVKTMNTARFLVMTAFNFISHIWTNPVNIIRVMRYNTIVFRRTSSNIQIKDGSTIAAYVAFTQKPFRTNEVLGVRLCSQYLRSPHWVECHSFSYHKYNVSEKFLKIWVQYVVQGLISANLWLNFDPGLFTPLFKSLFRIFSLVFFWEHPLIKF